MAKFTGSGALVEVDVDGTPTWTSVGCTYSITPPPQVKTDVEMTCQQDAQADAAPGIEQLSQFSFEQPFSYVDSKATIDDLYDAGTTHDWRITFTRGADSMAMEFSGYVSGLVPNAVGGADPANRVVTVTRTNDKPITYTTLPV